MVAEVWWGRAYLDAGLGHIITPSLPSHRPASPAPPDVVRAALALLKRANSSRVWVSSGGAVPGLSAPVLLHVQPEQQQQQQQQDTQPHDSGASSDAPQLVYHVWPRHGIVLNAAQYDQLLRPTAADAELHAHASVLQLLDAAWLTALSGQRRVRRLQQQLLGVDVSPDLRPQCGPAGLG